MTVLQERLPAHTAPTTGPSRRRPVILATVSVPVDADAERIAIESAREACVPLVLVDLLRWPPCLPAGILMQADLEAVRRTASRAAGRGVDAELLRLVSARGPARTLRRLARERDAGMVVFGPDPRRTGRRAFRRTAQDVCDGLDCLVWIADAS